MYVLIRFEDGLFNDMSGTSYYTIWAAQQAMAAEFGREYEDYYDTTEPPKPEDNGVTYLYDGERAIVSYDDDLAPQWAIVEVK